MSEPFLYSMYPRTGRNLSAIALFAAVVLFSLVAYGQVGSVTVLHSFTGGTEGSNPNSLVQSSDGSFYGATTAGGANGDGSVFEIAPAGGLTTLDSFSGSADGASPNHLVLATDGNFYGITGSTVFETTPTGATTTIRTFTTDQDDATLAPYDLIAGTDGSLYGAEFYSGTPSGTSQGSLFEVTLPATTSTPMDKPPGRADSASGGSPKATYSSPGPVGLSQGSDGNIYYNQNIYTTSYYNVVQYPPSGTTTTIFAFDSAAKGYYPSALVQTSDGNLFGTTTGSTSVPGTIFQLTPAGVLTTLYVFNAATDGTGPSALTVGMDGNFYGTLSGGGGNNDGVLFRVTPAGAFTILHPFVAATEGSGPTALIQGSDGNLYGTMSGGGSNSLGVFYRLTLVPSDVLVFSTVSTTVDEAAGSVTITVTRPELTTGAVGVSYATADGTALAGTDYAALSGTLSWADGDATSKTFVVPILDRGLSDGTTRVFSVALSAPTGGAALGVPATATVTIKEDDPPVLTGATSASGQVGQAFSYQITATGTPTSYDATGLPAGLSIDPATGLISGTPTEAGPFTVDLTATTAGGTGTGTLALTVLAAPSMEAPVISSAASASGQVSVAFSYQIAASNAPTGFAASGLPLGLGVNAASGLITGTPTQAGTFTISLSASNTGGTGTATLTVTVASALPVATLTAMTPMVIAGSGDVGEFTVSLSPAQDHDVIVNLTIEGSAVNGTDYVLLKTIKKFHAGQTTRPIRITPIGAGAGPGVKRVVTLQLAEGGNYTVGTVGKSKVKIYGQ